ncbi:hypothetical protein ACLXNF_24410 [Mycobacteroides chelonae]|uniref:hypothetical protein n=1 Tax=Mycobacteroides chelonae TaxID=1774 RepID=UPI0039EC28D3
MTLNITLAARWLMAQSSDFRLTYEKTDGTIGINSHTAQKQFVLYYTEWSGLLCYTGVAKYGSHDTAEWLTRILTHSIDEPRSPLDVANVVASEGSTWLPTIPKKYRYHTFTLIAYDRAARPNVWLISNYQSTTHADLSTPDDKFSISHIGPRSNRRSIVTGQHAAVTSEQRASLEDLLAHKPRPEALSDAIALINRDASVSAQAQQSISKECVVATLLPDGSGEVMVYGNLPKEFLPVFIVNGLDPVAAIPETGKVMGPGKMLSLVRWADRKRTLEHVHRPIALVTFYRSISGYKWPDEPGAPGWPPRQELVVSFDDPDAPPYTVMT